MTSFAWRGPTEHGAAGRDTIGFEFRFVQDESEAPAAGGFFPLAGVLVVDGALLINNRPFLINGKPLKVR